MEVAQQTYMFIHSFFEWQFLTSVLNGLLFLEIHFSQSGLTMLYVVFFFLNSWVINLNVSFLPQWSERTRLSSRIAWGSVGSRGHWGGIWRKAGSSFQWSDLLRMHYLTFFLVHTVWLRQVCRKQAIGENQVLLVSWYIIKLIYKLSN